jgi:hypothetical protein
MIQYLRNVINHVADEHFWRSDDEPLFRHYQNWNTPIACLTLRGYYRNKATMKRALNNSRSLSTVQTSKLVDKFKSLAKSKTLVMPSFSTLLHQYRLALDSVHCLLLPLLPSRVIIRGLQLVTQWLIGTAVSVMVDVSGCGLVLSDTIEYAAGPLENLGGGFGAHGPASPTGPERRQLLHRAARSGYCSLVSASFFPGSLKRWMPAILSGVYCVDSVLLLLYRDECSGSSETIGDYYSTSTRLCCEDSILKTLLRGFYYQDYVARSMLLARVYYQESIIGGVYCQDSIIKTLLRRLYYQDCTAKNV